MNASKASTPPVDDIQVLSDRDADHVNGALISEIADGVAAVVGAVVDVLTVNSPRDAASGLATGKRQHKPFT